jgi:vancomycin resistance protein VanJ
MLNTQNGKMRHLSNALPVLVYGYLLLVAGVMLLLSCQGDRRWYATLLMYGPRWIYIAPLVVLVPGAFLIRPRLLLPLGLGSVISIFSLMGMCIPWRTWWNSEPATLRVLSYNIERYKVPGDEFSELLDREQPDLIAVQECAGVGRWTDWWVRHSEWHTVHRGELLIASRFPIKSVEVSYSRWPPHRKPVLNAIYCVLSTPQGEIGFCNLHLDTPRRALSAILDGETFINLDKVDYADYRLACRQYESTDLLHWLSQFPQSKIIAGDFNMAPDSFIFRSDWAAFRDAFEWAGWGFGFTKRTVIRQQEYGLRIDRVITDGNWTPKRSWVGPDLGPDHLPLFADIARSAPKATTAR